jgi:hypothetical protein
MGDFVTSDDRGWKMSHPFVASDRQAEFTARMEAEFVVGSGISPLLYAASTRIVWDMEELPGGEVGYPIAEALNWNVTRFGRQARTNQLAILLLQESGDCWQSKFDQARIDLERGKAIKYESVRGKGSTAFLPAVDVESWAKIALLGQRSDRLWADRFVQPQQHPVSRSRVRAVFGQIKIDRCLVVWNLPLERIRPTSSAVSD